MSNTDQQTADVVARLRSHQAELEKNGQRDIVVIEGDGVFADDIVKTLVDDLDTARLISNRHEAAVPFSQVSSCLGQESLWVIVDLHDSLDVDVFCVAAGLVTAGGILLLLWPGLRTDQQSDNNRLSVWQDNKRADFPWFEFYLFESIRASQSVGSWIRQQDNDEQWLSSGPGLTKTAIVDGVTADQAAFIGKARQWLTTSKPGIFLLLADRGRGKSTALGLLCDALLHDSSIKLVVTAPSRQAAAMLLDRAAGVRFIAPDGLLESRPHSDLVLIDEAAMIPQSMLRQICDLYSRVILATTTGGYEGTGQGFLLRFKAGFDASRLQQITLQSPVRWCAGDQVETWLKETLLAETEESAGVDRRQIDLSSLQFRKLEAGSDVALIKQAYVLLMSAHYRTAPSDLQLMMENPDCQVVIAQQDDTLVGAMLLNREGGLDGSLSESIFLGKRRPKGHLLAQMITVQTGASHFATYRGLRIQRIAVPVAYRRQGIGTALVEKATHWAKQDGRDYLGASFALDSGSIEFWADNQFTAACLSVAQGKSSGSHSIAVFKPMSEETASDAADFVDKLHRQLPGLFLTSLQTMEAEHAIALLRQLKFQAAISQLEINDMTAFTEGERGLESCFISVQKQVMQAIAKTTEAVDPLVVYKAVLHRPWSVLPRNSGSEGKRQLQQRLREQVKNLLAGSE